MISQPRPVHRQMVDNRTLERLVGTGVAGHEQAGGAANIVRVRVSPRKVSTEQRDLLIWPGLE